MALLHAVATCARLAGVAALALCAVEAPAIGVNPCAFVGNTTWTPRHPGPLDSPGYNVSIPDILLPADERLQIVTRPLVAQDGSLSIDVVVTAKPGLFPDHKRINVDYRVDSTFEHVGPLSPGDHRVTTDVRMQDGATGNYASACGSKETVLSIETVSAQVQTRMVVEFYHPQLDHYFITQDLGEIGDLDGGKHAGWSRTGESFQAYAADMSDGRGAATCRWYGLPGAGLDTHVQSASLVECGAIALDRLTRDRWQLEASNVFEIALPDTITGACPATTRPVYRLWNQRADSNHRYTTDPAIKAAMVAKGYVPEGFGADGVAMCSPM